MIKTLHVSTIFSGIIVKLSLLSHGMFNKNGRQAWPGLFTFFPKKSRFGTGILHECLLSILFSMSWEAALFSGDSQHFQILILLPGEFSTQLFTQCIL